MVVVMINDRVENAVQRSDDESDLNFRTEPESDEIRSVRVEHVRR